MARNKYDIDETLERGFDFTHLKRSLTYVKKHKKKMALSLFISIVSVILGLFSPMLMQKVFDEIVPAHNVPALISVTLIIAACLVGATVLSQCRQKIMCRVSNQIIYEIRRDLFEHMQKLPFKYYDDRPHGKILVRLINYVNAISDVLSNGIINLILETLSIVFILIFMFLTSPQLSLVILAGMPVLIAVVCILKPLQTRLWRRLSNKSSNYTAYVAENISGIKIIQAFGREEENKGIFNKLITVYRSSWICAVFSIHATTVAVDSISFLVTAAVYTVGILVIGPEIISFGILLAMINYASRFWQPIINIASIYNNFLNALAYLERVFEAMDEPITICDRKDAIPLGDVRGNIDFSHVSFSYEEEHTVLEDINLHINAGESIAIVGPTGAGKTTIVNLLSRFYDIKSGKISIDGTDISTVSLASLRSSMGIMLQDSIIFSGTVRENIQYGKLDATDEEIYKALRTVCAEDFVRSLPQGLDTVLTSHGTSISQGQRQLLCFARTVVSDPKILILDEATASIDTKTERLMQEGINSMMRGRTSFVIAHRLSTIKGCDKIIYIDNKHITEIGSHSELMARHGDYYKLYTTQVNA